MENTNCKPISFAIKSSLIVNEIPKKTRPFSLYEPGNDYSYENQEDYYKGYQESYYGLTFKKAGWDCLRHYEILANGCIPYYKELINCPSKTMHNFPKSLVIKAMSLPGIDFENRNINFDIFPKEEYFRILEELLDYTRKFLTTSSLANYFLKEIKATTSSKILFISGDIYPDYQKSLLLQGLREVMGSKVIDFPKINHLYKNFTNKIKLYGNGFTYSRHLEDDENIDRNNIIKRIKNKEFDYIVYSSAHRGLSGWNDINKIYSPDRIVLICGEDIHNCQIKNFKDLPYNLFVRELGDA